MTLELPLTGRPASPRDGRLRAAISRILNVAAAHGAKAVVIENLDFADVRQQVREHAGNRPIPGRAGPAPPAHGRRHSHRTATGSVGPDGLLTEIAVIAVDLLTPPGGAPSTGSPTSSATTTRPPDTTLRRW